VSLPSQPITAQKPKNLSLFLIALGVTVALLYYGQVFFVTLVIAITIAFLLDPFVELLMKLRLPRSVASFIVCVVGLLVVYLMGLGAYTQVAVIIEDLPTYSERIAELVDRAAVKLEQTERRAYELLVPRRLTREQLPEPEPVPSDPAARRRRSAEPPKPVTPAIPEVRIREERTPLIARLYDYLRAFYLVILMASFVPFLVYFMLSWKDHFRRSYLQLFHGQDRQAAGRSWEGIAGMARAYVFGNFVLGVILSVASGLFFWAIKLPYFLLIGPLSGFLSLIPYIGFPLAMIPPFFVALPVYDQLTPYLVIGTVVGFFHLLALNLLYPKLVGSRVHLNPLAVTIALMFFGVLWGGVGLILAIPIAAGIKAVCDNVPGLQAYGKLLGD
jgi:predicted PurR-regulated permease PerM